MVDVVASRPDNGRKDIIRKIVPFMPRFLLAFLLQKRVSNPNYHEFSERIVTGTSRFEKINIENYNNILLVDDSVDTGWSLIKVKEFLEANGVTGKFKTASYCVLSESKKRVSVEYYRHMDSIAITATSRYSKEYSGFIREYSMWKTQMDDRLGLSEK